MANYSHDRIVPFKDSELGKKQQIAEMFDKIAFRYDFLNHFLSGGIDVYWRRRAIRELRSADRPIAGSLAVLDVATGTGDLAILLTRFLPGVQVTGVDISTGMLQVGQQKIARLQLEKQITLLPGDSEALPFADGQFDAVTVAFGVRNFENLEQGLKEMFRVLKPGGKLIVLEFSQPRLPGIREVYNGYLRLVAPKVGKMISSSREAYQYLNDSVKAFPEGKAFTAILDSCGYANPRLRRLSLGICSLYTGVKPV